MGTALQYKLTIEDPNCLCTVTVKFTDYYEDRGAALDLLSIAREQMAKILKERDYACAGQSQKE